jgi:hypothetical protein
LKHRPIYQYSLLAGSLLFLAWLAWQALVGGLRQISRSHTAGQKVETVVQLECGFLSLLVILTTFHRRQWGRSIQRVWEIFLITAAGLSTLVWGPPMPGVGVLFSAAALLLSRAIQSILQNYSKLPGGTNNVRKKWYLL